MDPQRSSAMERYRHHEGHVAQNKQNSQLPYSSGQWQSLRGEKYKRSFQTRDVFTIWGILQLLRKYPGQIPDVDLMFDCNDWPVVKVDSLAPPPPLFGYCGDNYTLDIVFPDWSFWGW